MVGGFVMGWLGERGRWTMPLLGLVRVVSGIASMGGSSCELLQA